MRLFLALPTVSFVLIMTGNLYAQSEDEGQSRRGRGFDIMRFDENKDGKVSKDEVPERMRSFFDRTPFVLCSYPFLHKSLCEIHYFLNSTTRFMTRFSTSHTNPCTELKRIRPPRLGF